MLFGPLNRRPKIRQNRKNIFLSSFPCKCWTLNVVLLHNSSDYLGNTWWSMKTIKAWVFVRSSPGVKKSQSVIQFYTRRWIHAAISIYPATFKRLSKREWFCFPSNAALRFSGYNIFSKRKLECDCLCVIVYYGSKIVLFSFTIQGIEEIWVIYIRTCTCRAFCILCQLRSYMYAS